MGDAELQLQYRVVHGYRRAFRMAGKGPALVLIHGIGDSSATWAELIPQLARTHTVIAPDLLATAPPTNRGPTTLVAAYANGVRDLLTTLGIESATLLGHSLGGGVAMQFAYQFPERTERLVPRQRRRCGPRGQPRAAARHPSGFPSRPVRAPVARHAPASRLSP
ncbi:alpha/beta fold hydrolase [Streptomyces sp. L7]